MIVTHAFGSLVRIFKMFYVESAATTCLLQQTQQIIYMQINKQKVFYLIRLAHCLVRL